MQKEQLSFFPMGKEYWWLNNESLAILNRGYLLNGETVKDAIKRITTSASNNLNKPELQPIFEEIIAKGWVSLSSPIWANMGTQRGLPISCFSSYIEDSIESITDKLGEVIMQTKIGGGTSGYFGELRGRGAFVTNNGKSSGSVSFMELFNTAMNVVSQGCFQSFSEILTKDGYVTFKQLDKKRDKEILAFDFDTKGNIIYFYEKPVDYIKYWYEDDLYTLLHDKFEIKCTKDHKLLLFTLSNNSYKITAEELFFNKDKYEQEYYFVSIGDNIEKIEYISIKDVEISSKNYKGYVYCIETPNNNIIVKSDKNKNPIFISNSTRRGSFASYLDIDHPDIEEFLQIKDIGHPIQNLFYAVCVPDYWIKEMIDGDEEKRRIWAKVLESRQEKGLPFIFFTDNVNRNKPEIYKYLNIKIHNSNLCSEIALPTSKDESFVCCLASMNLELYDEWKDTKAVQYAVWFLDAVLSEFIEKTKDQKHLQTARNFAIRNRAIGLGTLGLHSYYQKIGRPFSHPLNIGLNKQIFSFIRNEAEIASRDLAKEYGYAPIFNEVGEDFPKNEKKRNTTLLAIAP